MNGLYFWVGGDVNDSSIIARKIKNQIKSFQEAGYNIRFVGVENRRNSIENIKWFLPHVYNYTQNEMVHAFDVIDVNNYGFVYIRMPTASPPLIDMLKRLRSGNSNIKIIMEVPTYPVVGERQGLRKIVDYYGESTRKKLHLYVDRIVTFSKDDYIWKIPTIKTVNCADLDSISRKKVCNNGDRINVITVSSYDYWHGYDRFLRGMGEYYKNESRKNIIYYYIVGEGVEISKYKKIVKDYHLENYVAFVGERFGDQLNEIYDKCELALDSMGRHRSHIYYNSSLKGKEYCAKGLPIISGVSTELDDKKDYPYYMRVPANNSNINMKDVIDFYSKIYCHEKSKDQIANEIRAFAKANFDFRVGLAPVIDYINSDKK